MTNKEEFEFFIGQLYENAALTFRKTEEYALWQQKLAEMNERCDGMFTPTEKEFAADCFELIMDADGQESIFIYRRGIQDSVKLLKWMGVLS